MTMMAMHPELRTVRYAREHMNKTPLAQWALEDPVILAESTVYKHVKWLARRHDHLVMLAANIQLVRALAGARTAIALAVDGMKHPANTQQRSTDSEYMKELLGEDMADVTSTKYTGDDHHLKDAWTGYKLMSLLDLATGLPLVWDIFTARVSERRASLELLAQLFSIWPDAPVEYLIGDGLYAGSHRYLYLLEFAYGIHPVVPFIAHEISRGLQYHSTAGVPTCRHGLMRRRDHVDFLGHARRNELGLRPGQMGPDHARIRFVCAHGDPNCENVTLYTRDDGRIYPYLLHNSLVKENRTHDRSYVRRRALSLRRNGIESHFAGIQHHLIGVGGSARTRVRNDATTRFLVDLHCFGKNGVRTIHINGSYDRYFAIADRLGLIPKLGTQPRLS